jgi:murein DD-endopeptidase MepM/ murein hydrolase activator NlpD
MDERTRTIIAENTKHQTAYLQKLSETQLDYLEELETIKGKLEFVAEEIKRTSLVIQGKEQSNLQKPDTPKTKGFILPTSDRLTSPFGMRKHPVYGNMRLHSGIDLGAYANTPVKASKAGTVIFAGWLSGYGNVVKIDHSNNYTTLYAHLNSFKAKVGDKVNQGDVIALSGNTGLGTAAHLHFEIRINNKPVNPLDYINK